MNKWFHNRVKDILINRIDFQIFKVILIKLKKGQEIRLFNPQKIR